MVKVNSSDHDTLSFEGFFFNDTSFLDKQNKHRYTFISVDSSGRINARATLFLMENMALSPLRAPFGSIEFETGLPGTVLNELIKEMDAFALNNQLEKIKIASYPDCYHPENSRVLKEQLLKNGFIVTAEDHNYHVEVRGKEFESSLHSSERRRLKKSQQAGFQFNVEVPSELGFVHKMISECREYKGYPVSMNLQEFEKMFKDFPGRYILFTIRDKGRLIAATIGVRINADILYNFMPADEIEYRNFSPMVLLMKHVFEYCRENKYKIFDMGTAAENGVPNSGLLKFKENLGGELSYKLTFEKSFVI
jgi:hypothetical protein